MTLFHPRSSPPLLPSFHLLPFALHRSVLATTSGCHSHCQKSQGDDVPSVLERLASFPTALPVSLQLSLLRDAFAMPSRCLCDAFAMPSRCSPLKFFVPGASLLSLELPYCRWSFPTVAGASLLSLELPRLPWSFAVFPGVPQSSPEFSSLCWSSSLSAGVPPCPSELLLLPQSPFPSEFFGDSLQSFPCLRRAFLLSPMTLLLHHSFAVL